MKTRDIDIRISLNDYISDKFKYDSTTRIINELNICYGSARVDIAAVNGSFYGYEIKSDSDTLERLPQQAEYYNKVFDYINLVCSEKFISDAEKIIPSWWGINIAKSDSSDTVVFYKFRDAKTNENLDAFSLAQLLRKEEALLLLNIMGAEKKMSRLPKYVLWEEISKNCPIDLLRQHVRIILKQRENWKFD